MATANVRARSIFQSPRRNRRTSQGYRWERAPSARKVQVTGFVLQDRGTSVAEPEMQLSPNDPREYSGHRALACPRPSPRPGPPVLTPVCTKGRRTRARRRGAGRRRNPSCRSVISSTPQRAGDHATTGTFAGLAVVPGVRHGDRCHRAGNPLMKTFPSSTASQTCPSRSFVALTVSMVTLPQSMSIASGGGGLRNLDCRKSTGCGAAWLTRLTGGQEVPGSNPGSPTR